jgi:prepilin-type N-terminal cleavage/methylation domain-containing protein
VIDRVRGDAGYSLVELLTVMSIMSIVFAGVTTVFVSGSKAQAQQERRFQAQLNTRLALDKIRRDIHCASDVSPTTGFPTSSVTLTVPTGCGGNVSWCTAAVGGSTTRYALYRRLGSTCSSSTGVKVADYLTNTGGNVFVSFLHDTGCSCLASLEVDFRASVKGSTIGAYEITDKIYLRNSTRI